MISGQQLSGGNCQPDSTYENPELIRVTADLFFADEEEEPELVLLALSICENCPVLSECIDIGMPERYGVWGGLLASERRHMRQTVRHT